MRASFQGFPKAGLQFLRDLELNNEREWFDAHKATYTEVVKPAVEALVASVGAGLMKFAPAYATEPKKAIYRIYRDTRFSHNKTPYKTNVGALFYRADLGKNEASAFYVEISPKHVGIAGGCYMPDAERLRLIRVHIAENYGRFSKLVGAKALVASMGELQGERLSRPPKGFPAEHPAVEVLKGKQWYYWREFPPETALTPGVVKEILTRFQVMLPVVEFLNEPMAAARKQRAPLETGWV
ncbi:MAG TPA: DUF2461 domain-containing protein [Paludibaculum sp.]|jgi:uncharacterized protein (TIGR02453 family)